MGWKPGKPSKFQPILATQEPLTAFHGIKQNIFLLKKPSKMADSKKLHFSKPSIFNIFLQY
jgi:hypothetical protein